MKGRIKSIIAVVLAVLMINLLGCGKRKTNVVSSQPGLTGGSGGTSSNGEDPSGGENPSDDGNVPGADSPSDGNGPSSGGDDLSEEPADAEPEDTTGGYADYVAEEFQYRDVLVDKKNINGKLAIYFLRSDAYPEGGFSGDCSILIAPDGTTMMIDVNNFGGSAVAVDYLERLGIKKIDYLVITHPDADHVYGYKPIFNNFEIGQVFTNASLSFTLQGREGYNIIKAADKKGIPHTVLKEGDSFKFGPVDIKVLSPPADRDWQWELNKSRQNAGSLAFSIKWKNAKVFFGGDLETEQELYMIEKYGSELNFDVVKMNHHGCAQQNSPQWVDFVKPKIAVAEQNAMADEGIYLRYVNAGCTSLHTCLDGTVLVTTSGDGYYDLYVEHDRTNLNYAPYIDIPNGHIRVKGH